LAQLAGESERYDTLKENITKIVSELPMSVNVVAKNRNYINKVLTESFWKI
jgi:type I restriction enzyme R subunit